MPHKKTEFDYQTEALDHIFECLIKRLNQIIDEFLETKLMPSTMAKKMADNLKEFVGRLCKYNHRFELNQQDICLLKNLKDWFAIEGKTIEAFRHAATMLRYMDAIVHFDLKGANEFQKYSINLFKRFLDCLKAMNQRIQALESSKHCKIQEYTSHACTDRKLFSEFSWLFDHLSAMLIRSCLNYKMTEREMKWRSEFRHKLRYFADSGDATFINLLHGYETWLAMRKEPVSDYKAPLMLSVGNGTAHVNSIVVKKEPMDTSEDGKASDAPSKSSIARKLF